jgi:hypothetical protein
MSMSGRHAKLKTDLRAKVLGSFGVPPVLWSKGIASFCDFSGPDWYRYAPTESTQTKDFFREHYIGARDVIWVRLSTLARDPQTCDLDTFATTVLPTITAPFTLLTTDGDASVPSDLLKDTVERILDNPFLVFWYSQNCDGSHLKIKPFPIGLDLHTPLSFATPAALVRQLKALNEQRDRSPSRSPRIFSDFSISRASHQRQELVEALGGCPHVDFLQKRVSRRAIWKLYSQYPFVLSTTGNGMDCHRTWELLCLGCIVATKTSPLDPLYEGLPVLIVEEWRQLLDAPLLERAIETLSPLTRPEYIWQRLRPETYLMAMRHEIDLVRHVDSQSAAC